MRQKDREYFSQCDFVLTIKIFSAANRTKERIEKSDLMRHI